MVPPDRRWYGRAIAVTSCSSGGDDGNRLTVNDTAYEITDVTIWDGGDGPPEYFADTSSVDIRISGTDGGVDGGVLTVEGTLNDSSSGASCSFSYSGPYIYESW